MAKMKIYKKNSLDLLSLLKIEVKK